MNSTRPLFITVILGTPRQGRMSEHVANLVASEVAKYAGVETEIVDIKTITITINNAGEDAKDPKFSATCNRADAFNIVAPEYNHGYPGLLKHVLDTNLKEYIHKAVGIVGVSAGPFGGTRVVQNLLPVMRELHAQVESAGVSPGAAFEPLSDPKRAVFHLTRGYTLTGIPKPSSTPVRQKARVRAKTRAGRRATKNWASSRRRKWTPSSFFMRERNAATAA